MNFKDIIGKRKRNIERKRKEKELKDLVNEVLLSLKNRNKNKK